MGDDDSVFPGVEPMVPYSEWYRQALDYELQKYADPFARLRVLQRKKKMKKNNETFLKEWNLWKESNPNWTTVRDKSFPIKDEDMENSPEKTAEVCPPGLSIYKHYCFLRESRFLNVQHFIKDYHFVEGVKIYMDDKVHIVQRSVKCFASAWAAVHGCHSVCMVTSRDMDMTHHSLSVFAAAVISEVECIPYEDAPEHDPALRRYCAGHVESPFCVVSAGGLERDLVEGMDLFWMKDRSTFKSDTESFYGTIQAAIRAYQYLRRGVVLEAEDIWVTVMPLVFGELDHLPMDIIREQLAMVNGSSTEAPLYRSPNLEAC